MLFSRLVDSIHRGETGIAFSTSVRINVKAGQRYKTAVERSWPLNSPRDTVCLIPAFEHQSPENNLFSGLWPYNRQYAFIIQKGNSPRCFIRSIKIHPSDNSISLSLFLAACILPVSLNPILRYSRPAFTLFSSIQSVGVSMHFVMANCSNFVPYPLFCFWGRI